MTYKKNEMIENAFYAINGKDWNRKNCQCDPDVGMAPCQYCAMFN